MLEKSPGNFQVDKLCIILLFEADFNQLNKHIGREMMHHTEQHGLVAREQYGSWHGCSSITQSLNKCLTFDQIRQLKQVAIVCSNDAKSCYNQIVHRIAAQSMFRCRVHKPALFCMFSTIQWLQHSLCSYQKLIPVCTFSTDYQQISPTISAFLPFAPLS